MLRSISVVIPSYNHAPYVATAIRSVLDQDYRALELIIVDDRSTDGSPEVIRAALEGAGSRVRVRFEEQEVNRGAHATIMRGLARATGEVLTILNSDDHYEPGRFTTMMAAVPAGDFIAFTGVRLIDEAGETEAATSGISQWYSRAMSEASQCPTIGYGLLRNNFSLTSGNLVFTRRLYERVGGFLHYRLCHDWDFLMRATHLVEPIFLADKLMAYRTHATNTLHSTQHLLLEEGVPALNTYVRLGRGAPPPNRLAPGWTHWPAYFDYFIDTYACWFSTEPIRQFLVDPPQPPAPFGSSWGDLDRANRPHGGYASRPHRDLDALALRRALDVVATVPGLSRSAPS